MQLNLVSLSIKLEVVNELMGDLREHTRLTERAEHALDNASRALAFNQKDILDDDAEFDGSLSDESLVTTPYFWSDNQVAISPMESNLSNFYHTVSNYEIMRERLFDL